MYRFFVKPNLSIYRDIREDYLDIYAHIYNGPEISKHYDWDTLSESILKSRALEEWTKSADFDPHGTIRQPVQHIQNIRRFFVFLLFLMVLFSAVLGWGIHHWALSGVTTLGDTSKWIISSFPVDIAAGVSVYWYLLSADTGVVQRMNEELSISPKRINGETRNTDRLFAFYLWNQSLNSRQKWPVLMFLILVRVLSNQVYNQVMQFLQSNMALFFTSDGLPDLYRNILVDYTGGLIQETQVKE